VVTIGRDRKNNSKFELFDFNGMIKRIKKIKLRKKGVNKRWKRSES